MLAIRARIVSEVYQPEFIKFLAKRQVGVLVRGLSRLQFFPPTSGTLILPERNYPEVRKSGKNEE